MLPSGQMQLSRQTLEKNVLSWALAGTGSVLFTRQVAV